MEEKTVLALGEAGVDTEAALRRLGGNAALYEKILMKFLDDQSFSEIGPALDQDDYETALKAAHTLKGVSANLGMDRLADACAEVVNHIRANEPDPAKNAYPELEKAYRAVCMALANEENA
ncbi:Hpt domain-containing protein [Anaerovorax odorimutans]|uniref:Hpt domain-containing protein n=1 Tax=Anaerovorax odorimutans TaxID=109327 RepID=A0ABT1RQ07_9FIRM|nr:Hpt domain-containing protein [Anaerovorax odorimutans]MCQ4637281.1 Hpt domain-containing protein [Anaerovorax odorimutans]